MGKFSTAVIILSFIMLTLYVGSEQPDGSHLCTTEYANWSQGTYGNYTTSTGNATSRPGMGATPEFIWDRIVTSWWGIGGITVVLGAVFVPTLGIPILAAYMLLVFANFFLIPASCLTSSVAVLPSQIGFIITMMINIVIFIGVISMILGGDR